MKTIRLYLLRRLVRRIIKKQHADADKRDSQSARYGDAGHWIRHAASQANKAIEKSLLEAVDVYSLDPVLLSLSEAKKEFRTQSYDGDEGGYGLCAFNEIMSDMFRIHRVFGKKSRYLLDDLI